MGPFEFIILFLSFIYTLGLTHVLFAVTRMVRYRRELVFSWPHALWMANALVLLLANWLGDWDFHRLERVPLGVIAIGFAISIVQYLVCALVSPDFERGETFDMRAFHRDQGGTYIVANLAIYLASLAINFAAGYAAGVATWSDLGFNLLLLAAIPFILLALLVRRGWAQIVGSAATLLLNVATLVIYIPALTR